MKKTDLMSLRDRKKLETRQQIQEAARALITEYGYEKTTMRALAKAAGVGLGTISLHFKDKKSLLLASFYDDIGQVLTEAIASVPFNVPVRDQLLYILRQVYGYYSKHTGYLRSVVKEALFTRGAWREAFDLQIQGGIVAVGDLIEAAKERGEVKPDVNGQQVAFIGWSLYINGLIDGLKQDNFDPDEQVAKVAPLLDVVFGGVLIEGGARGHQ